MSVLAMKRLNMCAMKKDQHQLIEKLQLLGVMEIDSGAFKDSGLENYNTLEEKMSYDRKAHTIDNALDALQTYVPEKKGLLASLEGKALIGKKKFDEIVTDEKRYFDLANEITNAQKQIIENRVTVDRNNVSVETLEPWLSLDMPMEFTHTRRVSFLIGTIDPADTVEEIYDGIGTHMVDLSEVEVQIVYKDKYQTCVVVACLREYEESVENGLHSLGFARISNTFKGVPGEEKLRLENENRDLEEENKKLISKLKEISKEKENLEILADYYRMTAKKLEVMSKFPQSESTFFISGYIPERDCEKVKEKLEKQFNMYIDIQEPDDEEDVPVLLDNKGIGEAVEGVVGSYGLPHRGEIDPSKIMGWFYIFLFGLMLSDAAYGFIIWAACTFLLKKYDRMEDSLRKSIKMFKYCGISTLIWGILFGGYFGDVVNVVSGTFFGKEIAIKPLWFAPLDEPMKLMMFCMLFGIIHLYTGLAIKGYMSIRDKKYMDFFCDVVLWYFLLTGLIMMLLPTELFYSLSQLKIVYPHWLDLLAKSMAIFGAVGILLMAGRRKKNPGLRLALGAYDLYNLTSWLSDLLSYSRLLALGLATGVIASVFNQIGSMLGDSIIGIIFFVIIFVIGHVFNLAINMLGAYVHTNRLQFVEFFGKFYEGGGRPFNPFKPDTKYVDIGEEK